ncbi:MAG TPA: T9SS type A sorting domain-containing protein [Bacteroidia bacterium]|nr:T9SS type A sorting domain-containing protein [Bacteroidia bacterium]
MKKLITSIAIAFCLTVQAQTITTVVGDGTQGYSGDGGQATAASLNYPISVVVDKNGNIFCSDDGNNVIRKITTTGVITTYAGTGIYGYSGDGGQANLATLNDVRAMAINNKTGDLYLVNTDDYRIRKVSSTGVISTFAGNGVSGYSGDGGQATAAAIGWSEGIAIDTAGNVYFADEVNAVIRKIDVNGIITTFAGILGGGYSGDNGLAINAQLSPVGLAADAKGNLFIADEGNRVIRKINTNGIITTIAGTPGVEGFSGDGGAATLAELSGALQIAVDAYDNLFISDFMNSRIRYVNNAGIISTIAGNGTPGYAGDNGPALQAEFTTLAGICFNNNHLYIADNRNYRIRKITFASTEGISHNSSLANQVSLYPNPNNGSFVVETAETEKQTLQLFDVNGKLVLTQAINSKTNIDATNLADGVYNLSLINANGVINKRLVIVR